MMTDTCEIFHISRPGKCYLKTIFSALALYPCNACKEYVHVVTSTLPSYFNLKYKKNILMKNLKINNVCLTKIQAKPMFIFVIRSFPDGGLFGCFR